MSAHQYLQEIKWLEVQIDKLAQKYPYQPSVIRQIDEYRYQIRDRELRIVFAS